MRNETVQGVASNAAQGAVKGMASQYGSNNKYWKVNIPPAQGDKGIIGDYMLEVCLKDWNIHPVWILWYWSIFLSYEVTVYLYMYFLLLLNGKETR